MATWGLGDWGTGFYGVDLGGTNVATALAGSQAIGQYDLCVVRIGRLNSDCTPVYGTNAGIITAAYVDLTASPELKQANNIELENGCGDTLVNVTRVDRVKFRNLSGTIGLFDYEMFELMFGGSLIHGKVGADYAGEVIGWAEPGLGDAEPSAVAFEVITRNTAQGLGSCQSTGSTTDYPAYTGYIFPKARFTLGDRQFGQGGAQIAFTGKSENNPNYGSGPWRDWDDTAAEVFPANSPMVIVGYDTLANVLAGVVTAARVGYVTTPAAS